MPKGSRGGQGGNGDLGNSGGGGGRQDIGNFPAKQNPFVDFRKWRKEFYAASNVDEAKAIMEKNGVVITDKLEKYIRSGKYPLQSAKSFIGGALATISRYGEGESFVGFGGYSESRSSVGAYYVAPAAVGAQQYGRIAVNIGHKLSDAKQFEIGAHEAAHHVEAYVADAKGLTLNAYSKDAFKRGYDKWVTRGQSSGDTKTDVATHISNYGSTANAEAIAEARAAYAKQVTGGKKASRLSHDVYMSIVHDARKVKGRS